jgi:hypothetical protein
VRQHKGAYIDWKIGIGAGSGSGYRHPVARVHPAFIVTPDFEKRRLALGPEPAALSNIYLKTSVQL